MRYILLVSFLLTSFLGLSQGGPKVDAIKFRGKITTSVRDAIDVPLGEVWLIWNTTSSRFEYSDDTDTWLTLGGGNINEGNNAVTDLTVSQIDNATTFIDLNDNGPIGSTPYVRLGGGESGSSVILYLTNDYAAITGLTNAEIDAGPNSSMVTKEWVLANASGGGLQNPATADLDMGNFGINSIDILNGSESRMYGQGNPKTGSSYSFHFYNPTSSIGATFGNANAGGSNGQLRIADSGQGTYLGNFDVQGTFTVNGSPVSGGGGFSEGDNFITTQTFIGSSSTNLGVRINPTNGQLTLGGDDEFIRLEPGSVSITNWTLAEQQAASGSSIMLKEYVDTKVANTVTGRTGTPVTSTMQQTQAQLTSDGDPSVGEIVFCSDCAPAETATASTLEINDYKSYDDRAIDAATFDLSNIKEGASVVVEINRASVFGISGATPTNSTWADGFETNTRQLVFFYGCPSNDVFIKFQTIE